MPQSYQDDEDEDKEEDLRERATVKVEDRVVDWERGEETIDMNQYLLFKYASLCQNYYSFVFLTILSNV